MSKVHNFAPNERARIHTSEFTSPMTDANHAAVAYIKAHQLSYPVFSIEQGWLRLFEAPTTPSDVYDLLVESFKEEKKEEDDGWIDPEMNEDWYSIEREEW